MMEQQALLQNILEELADYGKYKGTSLMGDDDHIPVRAAQRIVRQNFKGIRYEWTEEDIQKDSPGFLKQNAANMWNMSNSAGGPEMLQAVAENIRRMNHKRHQNDNG